MKHATVMGSDVIINITKFHNDFFNASGVGLSPLHCGHIWPIVPPLHNDWFSNSEVNGKEGGSQTRKQHDDCMSPTIFPK
jgi:hypothetical protein